MVFLFENADYHVHTCFSDGEATPEELAEIAVQKGLKALGFSDHAYTSFDTSYCMSQKRTEEYRRCIASLKEKYNGIMDIFCGIEQDYYSDFPPEGFDYVIGSVHYIKCGNEYVPVDETAEILRKATDAYFGGDAYEMLTKYYATVAGIVKKTACDIIGHFDLITKFYESDEFLTPQKLFDELNPRYKAAWRFAVDMLADEDALFEINYGAVRNGYRTVPYPADEIQRYILATGGKTIISSDNHSRFEWL